MSEEIAFSAENYVFGRTYVEWCKSWWNWILSIPKPCNPLLDPDGTYSSRNQPSLNVWFLAGSFGDSANVKRSCTIPTGRAVLFPVVNSYRLRSDLPLLTDPELVSKAAKSMEYVETYYAVMG